MSSLRVFSQILPGYRHTVQIQVHDQSKENDYGGSSWNSRSRQTGGAVLPHGRQHTEGPAARDYERERTRSGFHLFFSTFWMISTFCLFQMHMRDSLHQIDHGVIIHVLRAILRLFYGKNM